MTTFPPGTYTMTITGTVGDTVVTDSFDLTLVNPCSTSPITIDAIDSVFDPSNPTLT